MNGEKVAVPSSSCRRNAATLAISRARVTGGSRANIRGSMTGGVHDTGPACRTRRALLRVRRPPQHRIQRTACARTHPHPSALHVHPFAAQALALLQIAGKTLGERHGPVGTQHPVPGQVRIGVPRQHPRGEPGTPGQPGKAGHLAVAGHLAGRNRPHHREDASGRVVGRLAHGASIALREPATARSRSRHPPALAWRRQAGTEKAALRRPSREPCCEAVTQAQPIERMPRRNSHARPPEAGMVRIQAQMMRSITPIFSARGFLAKPTPMIAVEMLWVVDTGMPKCAARVSTVAELVSAAKPWIGCSLTILWPRVLMIRQPPEAVPAAITMAQVITIHIAIWVPSPSPGCRTASHAGRSSRVPAASAPNRVRAMMPMVFWASLWPWAKPMYAADSICALPKKAFTQRGRARRRSTPPARDMPAISAHSSSIITTPSTKPVI